MICSLPANVTEEKVPPSTELGNFQCSRPSPRGFLLKPGYPMPILARMEEVKALLEAPRPFVTAGLSAPLPGTLQAPAPAVDLGVILDEMILSIEGVDAAVLATVDGFGIARGGAVSDAAAHSAMLAAAAGLAHQLTAMGGGRKLRQLVVDHDAGLLILWPIGDQRVLGVLTATAVEQRRLRSFVQSRASWLAGES